jgi:hypothetical protein
MDAITGEEFKNNDLQESISRILKIIKS